MDCVWPSSVSLTPGVGGASRQRGYMGAWWAGQEGQGSTQGSPCSARPRALCGWDQASHVWCPQPGKCLASSSRSRCQGSWICRAPAGFWATGGQCQEISAGGVGTDT